MRFFLSICFLLGILLPVSASTCSAEDIPISGPIPMRNDFPLTAIHLSLQPQAATVLSAGENRFSVTGFWSNTSIVSDNFTVDDESFDTTFEIHRGIGDGLELFAGIPLFWRGGGILDDGIDDWHRTWGFPRGARDRTESNAFNIEGVRKDARGFKIKDDGLSLGNVSVGGKYVVYRDDLNSAALITEVSFPSFDGSYGHDGVDALAGAALTSRLSWTVLHSGAAAVMYSDDELDGIPYAPFHAEGFVVSENEFCGWPTLLIGLYGGTKTVEKISGFPEYFLYLDVGLRFAPVGGYSVSLNMRENPAPHDGTTDISFVAAIERGWR